MASVGERRRSTYGRSVTSLPVAGRPASGRSVPARFTLPPQQACRLLDVSIPALALLVQEGLVYAAVRRLPYPQWDTCRLDEVSVAWAAGLPGELARVRAAAPVYRSPEMAKASALGMVLRACGW